MTTVAPIRNTPRGVRGAARTSQFLLLLGLTVAPACAPIPTKPRPTVPVSGRVSDRLGRPIAGAYVIFHPEQKSLQAFYQDQRARTDSTGSYSLELVAGDWDLIVEPPANVGYERFLYEARVTVSPGNSRFDLVFDGFHVNGRVIAPTGAALTDAYVYVVGGDPSTGHSLDAGSSTESGVFSLLLPAGSYAFSVSTASVSGFPSQYLAGVPVQADTTFDILLGGDLITGTVYGPGALPLEGVLVTAIGPPGTVRARTALDGTYRLYARAGDYRFFCEPSGSNSYILARISTLRAIAGPGTLDFDLSGVEWTGTVRSSTTIFPVAGVGVTAALFGDAFYRTARAATGPAGQFRLVLEPGREYSLSFHSRATADLTFPGFLAANDTTFDVLLDPAPAP